ncbi:LamG domain-containing protein [Catenuloplanes japonicus]|uniref:LamG domain-containing protein n=1 Tax=Catenuloplanes japonicus TaxID=33876 RepID=UPI00052517D5|nr:LamG-like jellyroll fold domain-containing protein [Catenuloplanes japonicus]
MRSVLAGAVALAVILVPGAAYADPVALARPAPPTITVTHTPIDIDDPFTATLSSDDPAVISFTYHYDNEPSRVAPAVDRDGKKVADVAVTPEFPGTMFFSAWARTADGVSDAASVEVRVPNVIGANASFSFYRWDPWYPESYALEDQTGNRTVLETTDLVWQKDARLIDVAHPLLNGTTSDLRTDALLDTSGSFSLQVWARPDALAGDRTLLVQNGDAAAGLRLYLKDGAWCFGRAASDTAGAASVAACAPGATRHWTHLAGSHDADAHTLTLWVNGVVAAVTDAPPAWASDGAFRIGAGSFAGAVAELKTYPRKARAIDIAAQNTPTKVGSWNFALALPCWPADFEGLCDAPGDYSRHFTTTTGSWPDRSNGELVFDRTFPAGNPNDPTGGAETVEFGRSQINRSPGGSMIMEDIPVLRTDESFTVELWARPYELDGTAVAQGSFSLGLRDGRWSLDAWTEDGDIAATAASAPVTEVPDQLTHLVAVHDAVAGTLTLYVNGGAVATAAWTSPWHASRPMTIGARSFTGPDAAVDRWIGGLRTLDAWQGVTPAAEIAGWYAGGWWS